jgi:pyruvate dehydrogenase E1 component alpha subunit
VPIAAGAAFASKYRGDGRVTLCFFGEGSSTIGGFQEGIALAALWKLPCVFICENNQYSMGTPLYRSLAVEDVSMRALAHGMARDRFDGDDVIKVKRRIQTAVDRARETSEPTLVEVRTYRFRGHSMSDPGLYRTREEVDEWKRRDPVAIARRRPHRGVRRARTGGRTRSTTSEAGDRRRGEVRRGQPAADEYLPYVTKERERGHHQLPRGAQQAIREEMDKDERVFLMGEEVGYYQGAYKVSQGLLQRFSERRVIDAPIAEMGFAGVGIGAAWSACARSSSS